MNHVAVDKNRDDVDEGHDDVDKGCNNVDKGDVLVSTATRCPLASPR